MAGSGLVITKRGMACITSLNGGLSSKASRNASPFRASTIRGAIPPAR